MADTDAAVVQIPAESSTPVPPQWQPTQLYDLRGATGGPRGFKAKRKRDMDCLEEQAQAEGTAMDTSEQPASATEPSPPQKRVKLNTVGLGKASGRPWKEPARRASAVKDPNLSTSWEQKMKAKREHQLFQQHRKAAVEARKEIKTAARQKREGAKSRKEENCKKSAVTQTITSRATLRKMMKSRKGRKQLQVADTVTPT